MEVVNKKLVFLAIVLSLLTSLFIYSYINGAVKTTKPTDVIKVFVAAKTIEPRAMISDADIKEIQIDKKYILTGAYQNKAEIIGKRVRERILQGEQILKERIFDESKMNLAYSIPEGKRAVSIDVNEASEVANFIKEGDYVDILSTFEKEEITEPTGKTMYPKITKVILQNVLVLGIGNGSQANDKEPKKEIPKTVTLAVDNKDTEKLIFAAEAGVIRLALRPVGDEEITNFRGTIRNEVTGTKGVINFK